MNFFKSVAGIFMYIGAFFVPVEESSLQLQTLSTTDRGTWLVKSVFEFQWSDKSTEIVYSAIPIVIKYTLRAGNEKQELYRILRKPISQSEYFVIDSILDMKDLLSEKTYPNIQLALRHFKQTEWEIPLSTDRMDLTAEVEYSYVPSMDLYVDISPIFGGNKFVRKISIKKEKGQ